MNRGGTHTYGLVSVSEALERLVLALLAIRPRLPFRVLVGLLPNRPVRDLFAALRHLREQGRVVVIPTRRDCDILRVKADVKGCRVRLNSTDVWRLGC
jgi:hypothetical protein